MRKNSKNQEIARGRRNDFGELREKCGAMVSMALKWVNWRSQLDSVRMNDDSYKDKSNEEGSSRASY